MHAISKNLMSDRNSNLNAENNRDVTNDVMFAYANEKISILLSVLSILFSVFSYDFILNTQGFVDLEFLSINWASIETCKFSRNAMYA